jgi:hypothetical protein
MIFNSCNLTDTERDKLFTLYYSSLSEEYNKAARVSRGIWTPREESRLISDTLELIEAAASGETFFPDIGKRF